MANAYKNAKSVSLTTSLADIYTCPATTEAIVLGIQITNIDGTNAADATVAWTDSSDTDAVTYLIKSSEVAAGEAISAMAPEFKLVLETGDKIQAMASAASDLCISVSVLEVS